MKTTYGFGDYFECLAGVWRLVRHISSGEMVEGTVEFVRIEPRIYRVVETGQMQLTDGNQISAKRQWLWRLDGIELTVYFDETPPRLYHHLRLAKNDDGWGGVSDHSCPPDVYSGDYRFFADRFEVVQNVSGPKKDYRIVSEYIRF